MFRKTTFLAAPLVILAVVSGCNRVEIAMSAAGGKGPPSSEVDQKSQPTEWLRVADWSGSGIKQTESFTVHSREWRIYWKTKREAFAGTGFLAITVHRADNDDVVASAANKQGTGSDVSYVRTPPGRYYLSINSANAEWVIRVENKQLITGPPAPWSSEEVRRAAALAVTLKADALERKVSERQVMREWMILFIDALAKNKMVIDLDDDLRAWWVDGAEWKRVGRGTNEALIRSFSEYRRIEKGVSDVAIYDAQSELELASYTPRQGVRFR